MRNEECEVCAERTDLKTRRDGGFAQTFSLCQFLTPNSSFLISRRVCAERTDLKKRRDGDFAQNFALCQFLTPNS